MINQASEEINKRLQQYLTQYNLALEPFEELTDQATMMSYLPGSPIFLQGSSAELLLWLVKGTAKVYCPVDGERVLARLAGRGDLLGHFNFLNSSGRHRQLLEVHAVTKCEVAVVSRDCARRVLQKLEKRDILNLLDAMNLMWSQLTCWYLTLLGLSFRERLELVFKDLSARFGVVEKRGVLIIPELSQIDLAEMIGSSRPMISRLLKEMSESGELIRANRQHIISNRARWMNKDPLLGIVEAPESHMLASTLMPMGHAHEEPHMMALSAMGRSRTTQNNVH